MRIASAWGFLTLAATFIPWGLTVMWTPGHEVWGPRLLVAGAVCLFLSMVCFLWPFLRSKRQSSDHPPRFPNLKKSRRTIRFMSLDQFYCPTGFSQDKKPGSFELRVAPSNELKVGQNAIVSKVLTKRHFHTHFCASIRMNALSLDPSNGWHYTGARSLELRGRDVVVAMKADWTKYFIWEYDDHWKPEPGFEVKPNVGFNTLSIKQKGKEIDVWINGTWVVHWSKNDEVESGPVGVQFQADPRIGGTIHFEDFMVKEDFSFALIIRRIWKKFTLLSLSTP